MKQENSPNTCDSIDESLSKLLELSGQNKMGKKILTALEKLVQDKINCSNCIYILSREYMCLWLQAARAMPMPTHPMPPTHRIMLCCTPAMFWTACRIMHTRSHHTSVLGSCIARLCNPRPCRHGDPSYAVLLDRSTIRPPLPSVSKSAFVSILSITAFYFLIVMNTSLPMPMHD